MIAMIVELVIIAIWSAMLGIHTRRLLRLAQVALPTLRGQLIRNKLQRVWWWLGREEFWGTVQSDCARCLQLTFMVFLMAWGLYL